MRILSIRAVTLTPSKKIKMKKFLTQNPFLNKTRGCKAEISNSKTMTISCQCTFKNGLKSGMLGYAFFMSATTLDLIFLNSHSNFLQLCEVYV